MTDKGKAPMYKEEVIFAGFSSGDLRKSINATAKIFVQFSGKEVELEFDLGRPIGSQDDLYSVFDPLFQSFARAVAKAALSPPRLK